MMEKRDSRRIDVDFYEKDEKAWLIVCRLVDTVHDIKTEVEVSVPDMTITDANVLFTRYPLDVCPMIEKNVKKIIGLNLMKDYNMKSPFIFLGPKGCGNVMSLLGTGLQSFIYSYYPHQIRTGKMTAAEWEKFSITKLRKACLGHTLLEKGKARFLRDGA